MQQLTLRLPEPVSAVSVTVSRTAWQSASNVIVCLGPVLPPDFHDPAAPARMVSGAVCLPASLARVSVCVQQRTYGPCSGGVWLWSFQSPGTGQGDPVPLCSAHETLLCHCACGTPTAPYAGLCTTCMAKEHDDSTRFVELAEEPTA